VAEAARAERVRHIDRKAPASHDLVQLVAQCQHGLLLAVGDEGLLGLREGLPHGDHDDVVAMEGLCLHRASPDEATLSADDGVGDRVIELTSQECVLLTVHRLWS
jgi:hypothetical protein